MVHPDVRTIIPGSGGLRKLSWRVPGAGKRGGIRIIYYWVVARNIILLLFVFRKNERSNLTPKQLRILRQIVEKDYP